MAWQAVENYDKGGLTMASCKDCLHVDVEEAERALNSSENPNG